MLHLHRLEHHEELPAIDHVALVRRHRHHRRRHRRHEPRLPLVGERDGKAGQLHELGVPERGVDVGDPGPLGHGDTQAPAAELGVQGVVGTVVRPPDDVHREVLVAHPHRPGAVAARRVLDVDLCSCAAVRDALLAALFARRLDDLVARVETVLTSDRLLDDGLEATLRDAVDVVLEGYRAHTPVLRAALARVAVHDDLRTVYWDRHARALAVIDRFLRRGRRAGMVRAGDPAVLAHTVLVVTQGLNHPVLLTGDRDVADGVQNEVATLLAAR